MNRLNGVDRLNKNYYSHKGMFLTKTKKTDKVKDAEKALDDAKKNVGNKEKELEATKQAEDLRQKADKIENDAKKEE